MSTPLRIMLRLPKPYTPEELTAFKDHEQWAAASQYNARAFVIRARVAALCAAVLLAAAIVMGRWCVQSGNWIAALINGASGAVQLRILWGSWESERFWTRYSDHVDVLLEHYRTVAETRAIKPPL